MKISAKSSKVESRKSKAKTRHEEMSGARCSTFSLRPTSGFTMVEIALSLAIVGFALVVIIGVLPLGMNVQKDNREETIINQDATVFIGAIRNGERGLDDLTNYVYAITNTWTYYNSKGNVTAPKVNNYTYSGASVASGYLFDSGIPLTNGLQIVGLLSTPELTDNFGNPTNNLYSGGYSNHIVAYVHSLSGPAEEKPPQNNDIVIGDSFGYRILCQNAAVAVDTNALNTPYNRQLTANLRALRLTFLWPQLANGNLGGKVQSFRTLVAGQLALVQTNGENLYFYQPQSFTSKP